MNISYRIKEFCDRKNIKQIDLVDSGVGAKQTVNNVFKGKQKPSYDFILKLLTEYKDLDSHWLITGEGDMLKSEVKKRNDSLSTISKPIQIPVVTQDTSENTTIPLVDIKAAASYNTGYMQEGYIEELPPLSFPHHLINGGKQYYAFQVMGDSMHPTLYNNDYVIASFIEPNDWLDIKDEYIYVIVTESRGINIKRLKNRIKEHGFMRARSDNRSHPAFNIEANDILQIWEVKCKISFNMPNENESLYNIVMELKDEVESLKKNI